MATRGQINSRTTVAVFPPSHLPPTLLSLPPHLLSQIKFYLYLTLFLHGNHLRQRRGTESGQVSCDVMTMALEAAAVPPLIKPRTAVLLNRRFAAFVAGGFLHFPCSPFAVGKTSYRTPPPILAVKEVKSGAVVTAEETTPVRIVAVVGQGTLSPLKSTPWEEVMLHTVSNPSQFYFLLLFFINLVRTAFNPTDF